MCFADMRILKLFIKMFRVIECVFEKKGWGWKWGEGRSMRNQCEEYINVILKREWLSKFWNRTIII